MSEPNDQAHTPSKGLAAFILSPEFRWPYLVLLSFLFFLGLALSALGCYSLFTWYFRPGYADASPTSGIVSLACGVMAFILAMAVRQLRKYFRRMSVVAEQDSRLTEESIEMTRRKEDAVARIQQLQKERAEREFKKNVNSTIVLEQLLTTDMVLFPQAQWTFQPGLNVLLGRNGFGKSLILKSLAAALQNEEEPLKGLLKPSTKPEEPCIEVILRRNGEPMRIRKNSLRFVESFGKVPLLAIPDSRFVDRSEDSVGPGESDTADLLNFGAQPFILQKPFGPVVKSFLYGICLDYWEHGKTFDLPVFNFLQECVKRLTDYDFRFSRIDRKGDVDFSIRVLTEGNSEPVLLQNASQGTLSVLAMFGLIRRYVRARAGNLDDDVVQTGSGIVIIDEADAHLHPAWQQKFIRLLKDLFPNVQFILSAHSPLFVAGCWKGEVAVLRKMSGNAATSTFVIEQLDRDFVGVTAAELYKQVFDIEELDCTYLEYATKATSSRDNANRRLDELSARRDEQTLSAAEEEELRALEQEDRRINRAVQVQQKRREGSRKDAQIDDLESKVLDKDNKIQHLESQVASLEGQLKQQSQETAV